MSAREVVARALWVHYVGGNYEPANPYVEVADVVLAALAADPGVQEQAARAMDYWYWDDPPNPATVLRASEVLRRALTPGEAHRGDQDGGTFIERPGEAQ